MSISALGAVGVPILRECLHLIGPVAGIVFLNFVFRHTDLIIQRFFPLWEWEKELGWLNFRAYRRAEVALRWIGHGFHALLALALYGFVSNVAALSRVHRWNDPADFRQILDHLPTLLACAVLWIIYLFGSLFPRLRCEREERGLARYRAASAELEREKEEQVGARIPSRLTGPLQSLPPKIRTQR